MIEIDGNYYMDGGIADAIPVQQAFRDNMDRVVVILTRQKHSGGYFRMPCSLIFNPPNY